MAWGPLTFVKIAIASLRLRRDEELFVVSDYSGSPLSEPLPRDEAVRTAKSSAIALDRAVTVTSQKTGKGFEVLP